MFRVSLVVAFICAAAYAQEPRVDSVSPARGQIAGNTVITVSGANLAGAAIQLDGTPVTPLSQSDAEVRLQMPAHDNGYAVLSARNAAGVAYGEFLYVPPRLDDLPPGYITTVAGIGSFTRDYGDAKKATFTEPWGVTFNRNGDLYVGDAPGAKVYRINPAGVIESIAVTSSLAYPRSVAFDDSGNVYIGSNACRLQKVGPTGIVSTVAGDEVCGFSGDGGPAALARIGSPTWLVSDHDNLFFIDYTYVVGPANDSLRDAVRIRRIHFADGKISTFAGNGLVGFSGDGGPATAASFDFGPQGVDASGLALDPAGNLYIIDTGNGRIRRIDRANGIITTFYKPSPGTPDDVREILSITFDRDGNLYYSGSGKIVKVSPAGNLLTTWGNGTYALPVDGVPAATSGLGHIRGVAIDASGNIIYSDDAIARVRRINVATGLLDTVAGIGPARIGENGEAIAASLGTVNDIAFDRDGNLIVGETLRLRKLDRAGNLLTIGGTGSFVGRFPPAPANQVVVACPGVNSTFDGGIDIADYSVIDHVDSSGNLQWIAGHNAECSYTGDGGPAPQATICQAWDTARDAAGNLFIADTNNNRIRRVDAVSGIITTVAGNGGPVNGFERYGLGTFCGDGGKAIDACLNTPYGIAVDNDGTIFITENFGQRIRRVDPSGTISTFGTGNGMSKIRIGPAGLLYGNAFNRPGRFDRSGNYTAIAGTGESGFFGDGGPALQAKVSVSGQAAGVAIDGEGNFYFVDRNRIRAVRYGAVLAPANASIQVTANGSIVTATVRDPHATPLPGVRVNFMVAVASTGATCTLSSSFAITDPNGTAAVSCTSNCIAGSYGVTGQPVNALSSASTVLTNTAAPCHHRAVRH